MSHYALSNLADAGRFALSIPLLVAAISSGLAFGQERGSVEADSAKKASPELAAAKFKYDVRVETLQKPLNILAARYKDELVKIKNDLMESGDLSGLLEVQKEIERIGESGLSREKPAENPKLSRARSIYDNESSKLETVFARELASLNTAYKQRLEALQKELVKQGRLDDALEVEQYANSIPVGGRPFGKLQIIVQVDGRSVMYLRGDEIWFDHRNGQGAAPGCHLGAHPTDLDGKQWTPVWIGKVTEKHNAKIGLPTQGKVELRSVHMKGRGHAAIAEQPTSNNNFTAKIVLHDMTPGGKKFSGSQLLEFELNW